MLRFRAAGRLGRSISEWDEIPHDEQCKWMALAMLDGWGEETQRIESAVYRSMGAKKKDGSEFTSDDCEYYAQLNPPKSLPKMTAEQAEAQAREILLGW